MAELNRRDASAAVTGLGWRLVLGALRTTVPVVSLAEASAVGAVAAQAAGTAADETLRIDLRPDRVLLSLHAPASATPTDRETTLAATLTTALAAAGWPVSPDGGLRPVQAIEIAVDALDIPGVRPFWKAVFGYADDGDGALVDPLGEGPPIWFQQMDAPRPQRNRIHFDVSVPHDEAADRIAAALAAGGRLTYTDEAPAFWVLADPEGNEVCVTTWQGRD